MKDVFILQYFYVYAPLEFFFVCKYRTLISFLFFSYSQIYCIFKISCFFLPSFSSIYIYIHIIRYVVLIRFQCCRLRSVLFVYYNEISSLYLFYFLRMNSCFVKIINCVIYGWILFFFFLFVVIFNKRTLNFRDGFILKWYGKGRWMRRGGG